MTWAVKNWEDGYFRTVSSIMTRLHQQTCLDIIPQQNHNTSKMNLLFPTMWILSMSCYFGKPKHSQNHYVYYNFCDCWLHLNGKILVWKKTLIACRALGIQCRNNRKESTVEDRPRPPKFPTWEKILMEKIRERCCSAHLLSQCLEDRDWKVSEFEFSLVYRSILW